MERDEHGKFVKPHAKKPEIRKKEETKETGLQVTEYDHGESEIAPDGPVNDPEQVEEQNIMPKPEDEPVDTEEPEAEETAAETEAEMAAEEDTDSSPVKRMLDHVKEEDIENSAGGDFGCCRYCGQVRLIEHNDALTIAELNEQATRQCECDQGRYYDLCCRKKESAEKTIDAMFGTDAKKMSGEDPVDESIVETIKELSGLIAFGKVGSAGVYIGDGVSCKITMGSKGMLKIVRNKVEQKSQEV